MAPGITREDILNRARFLKAIPTVHAVVQKVSAMLSNQETSFDALAGIIQHDPAITAKIISIANSAWYNRGVRIVTVQRAMTAVGIEEIKRLLSCIVVYEGIFANLKLHEEDLTSLWKHSLYVACAARSLSGRLAGEEKEKLFTVALLHDIGMVPFYMLASRYRDIVSVMRLKKQSLCDMEEDLFGIDHQEVGFYLSAEWKLPEEFRRVIRSHHLADRLDDPEDPVKLVAAADRFAYFPENDGTLHSAHLLDQKALIDSEVARITDALFSA